MDASHLVRAVRRHTGLSQRGFAARSGLARRTIGAAEAGRQALSVTVLDRVLEAAGLDLYLCPRQPAHDEEQIARHLRRALTVRLRLAVGEPPSIWAAPRTTGWSKLMALSTRGTVVLRDQLAVAMWLPVGPVTALAVTLHPQRGSTSTDVLDLASVAVRATDEPVPKDLVPITLCGHKRVWVPPPARLAMPDAETVRLRTADRLLHDHAARDDADRRRPAHRDPEEFREESRLLVTKSADPRRIPDPRDSRAWRLDAEASLAQRMAAG